MKKRIISIIATLALLISSVPMNAMAASVGKSASNSISDVETHITLFGTRYITYNFNGMNVDSRNVGASWNRVAFEHMSESDKHKVSGWYLPGEDRTEQFGESGVQVIIKYINDSSGWSHAWKVMKDKIGKKYVNALRQYYGGGEDAEDDKDSYYNKEIDRLTTFDEGTAAYEVLTKYPYYEESGELFAMYGSIPEMMKVGKAGYDACVNAYYQDISAGTKAVSTFTLNFITDNCMVPGTFAAPSATMNGVRSAGYTLILTARGTIRDMLNQITGDSKQFADEQLREAIAGGSGTSAEDAIKVMRTQEKIIDENYKLAKYCHEQCEKFRGTIESKAQGVLDEIAKNQAKRDEEWARLQWEESERLAAAKPDTSGISRDGSYYSRIVAKEPTADPDKDRALYNKQLEEWKSVIRECRNELDNEFAAWKESSASDLEKEMLSMGFDAVIGDELPDVEITDGMKYYIISNGYYRIKPDWMVHYWKSYDMESFSESKYLKYDHCFNDDKMQSIEAEARAVIDEYESAISKRDNFISKLESLADRHESEYGKLYAKAKGIDEAGRRLNNGISLSNYDDIGKKVISRDVRAKGILYNHEDSYYASQYETRLPLGEDYYKVKIDNINNNMKRLRELRAEYKKEMEASLDDYIKLQSMDDSLISEYNKVVKERNEFLDSAPDYVKEQVLDNYHFQLINLRDPELYTLNTRVNNTLWNMIGKATENIEDGDNHYNNYQKAKNAFFKEEADKLEPMYEKLRDFDRRLSYIKDAERAVGEAKGASRHCNTLSDETLDWYGIKDHKGLHIGAAEKMDLSWNTENYDKEKRAMKLLLSDFRGTGSLQMKFMQAYADYKAKRSSALSAVSAGEMTYDDFRKEIYDPLEDEFYNVKLSYMSTYVGPYTNIGKDSEIDLQTMYDGEGCEVQKTLEMAKDLGYVPVKSVSPNGVNTAELNEGDSVQLSVTVSPANATSKKVNWDSLSPKIAGVDENGLVTAYSEGEAVIRAVAADAPLTEIKDEDGNVTGYETPDEFVAEFTINVSSQYATVIISYDSENGKIIINSDTSYENAELLIAEYSSDGMLIGVSPDTISIEAQEQYEKPYTANENYTTKIMLWKSLNKMKPLAAAVNCENTQM